MKIHEQIKQELTDAMTIGEIAERLDVARPHMNNVLNGHAEITIGMAIKLEQTFGYNAKDILACQLDERLKQAGYRETLKNGAHLRK